MAKKKEHWLKAGTRRLKKGEAKKWTKEAEKHLDKKLDDIFYDLIILGEEVITTKIERYLIWP